METRLSFRIRVYSQLKLTLLRTCYSEITIMKEECPWLRPTIWPDSNWKWNLFYFGDCGSSMNHTSEKAYSVSTFIHNCPADHIRQLPLIQFTIVNDLRSNHIISPSQVWSPSPRPQIIQSPPTPIKSCSIRANLKSKVTTIPTIVK